MHILFVYANVRKTPQIPLGIAYLSAALKQDGHTTSAFDTTFLVEIVDYREFSEKEAAVAYNAFNEKVEKEKPYLIAISSTSGDYPLVEMLLENLRIKGVPVIIGGIHATICPDQVIKNKYIDMLCIGEGELAMKELVSNMQKGEDITRIANLWVKSGNRIFKNDVRSLLQDLDKLPYPDYDLFAKEHLAFRHRTSRGRKVNYIVYH